MQRVRDVARLYRQVGRPQRLGDYLAAVKTFPRVSRPGPDISVGPCASRSIIAPNGRHFVSHSGFVKAWEDGLFEDQFYAGRDRYGYQGADYAQQCAADDHGEHGHDGRHVYGLAHHPGHEQIVLHKTVGDIKHGGRDRHGQRHGKGYQADYHARRWWSPTTGMRSKRATKSASSRT